MENSTHKQWVHYLLFRRMRIFVQRSHNATAPHSGRRMQWPPLRHIDFWWKSKWWAIIDGVSMVTFVKQIKKTNSSLNQERQEDTNTWVMWNRNQHCTPQVQLWIIKPVSSFVSSASWCLCPQKSWKIFWCSIHSTHKRIQWVFTRWILYKNNVSKNANCLRAKCGCISLQSLRTI